MDPTATPAPAAPLSTLTSILTTATTVGLTGLGTFLVTHGVMNSSGTEALISLAPFVAAAGLAGWREYVRPILTAQLEVLKAKSLAQAAALKAANLPKVTVAQIAAQSPTMGPPDVIKAIATLPPEIKATVAPATVPNPTVPAIVMLILGTALLGLLLPGAAYAQAVAQNPRTPTARPFTPTPLTGDPIKDINNAVAQKKTEAVANANQSVEDVVAAIQKLALPDFQYALAMSIATKNVVSTPCWQAWVDLVTAQQSPLMGPGAPVLDANGKPTLDANGKPVLGPPQALVEPDPHLITSVEQISELLANLRPDSAISTSCAALAAAAGKDAATLIQGILNGGALGLFKLPIPVGPIP